MKSFSRNNGFTLIELLVVITVIGILASVILASLNSARTKGQEAAIKSNLRNMIATAELSYDATGDYSGACAAIQSQIDAIEAITGTAPVCASRNATGDKNLRWGVTATNTAKDKNWSVDMNGVVTWDTVNTGSTTTWGDGVTACAAQGKKIPSIEQLAAIRSIHGGSVPPGFPGSTYWSGTEFPADPTLAYRLNLNSGGALVTEDKALLRYVRCAS